jgi:hypothetical protein
MLETDLQLGRYGITARLFKLISDMPKDKKLILLELSVWRKMILRCEKIRANRV